MRRTIIISWIGIISVLSLILFSEVYLSASDNNADTRKHSTADIVKFTIKPANLNMYPGGSMQLIAVAYDGSGKKIIVTPEWIIKSDVSSLGEFDQVEGEKVIFNALNAGTGSIVAIFNNLEAEINVKVFQPKNKK